MGKSITIKKKMNRGYTLVYTAFPEHGLEMVYIFDFLTEKQGFFLVFLLKSQKYIPFLDHGLGMQCIPRYTPCIFQQKGIFIIN